MLRVRLKIGDDEIRDTESQWGFIYLDSDKVVGPASKGFESTAYPEEEGEHIIPKSVDAPFDYTAKFFVQASSLEDANAKIDAFNRSLYTFEEEDSSIKTYKQVVFFNDYKRHKIVGYPYEISEAEDFWRDRNNILNDIAIVELKIRVTKPSLCEFKTPFTEDDSSD